MTDFMKCPVCGEDRNKDLKEITRVMHQPEFGLRSNHMNPGGREFFFEGRGRLQIGDQCNACDEKKIREFLGVPE